MGNPTMRLNELIQRVKKQQDKMGYSKYTESSLENRMDYLRDLVLALNVELVEMLQNVPWKPWKPVYEQTLNSKEAEREFSDVFVFLIGICLTINPVMDLEKVLLETLEKVDKRIENNYGIQERK